MHKNESLHRDRLDSKRIVVKCHGCHDAKQSLLLKRKTNEDGMQTNKVGVVAFNSNEPPVGDETPASFCKETSCLKGEPFNEEAAKEVIDICSCFTKNCFQDFSMIESRLEPN